MIIMNKRNFLRLSAVTVLGAAATSCDTVQDVVNQIESKESSVRKVIETGIGMFSKFIKKRNPKEQVIILPYGVRKDENGRNVFDLPYGSSFDLETNTITYPYGYASPEFPEIEVKEVVVPYRSLIPDTRSSEQDSSLVLPGERRFNQLYNGVYKIRRNYSTRGGELNGFHVHGNKRYPTRNSESNLHTEWSGTDYQSQTKDETVISPFPFDAVVVARLSYCENNSSTYNGGCSIDLRGLGENSRWHMKILHLESRGRPSIGTVIHPGDPIGTESLSWNHIHVILDYQREEGGDFWPVPMELMLEEPTNERYGFYEVVYSEGYSPPRSDFYWILMDKNQ